MNSDFEMHQKKKFMAENTSSSSSAYFPINPNHNLLQQANPFPFFQEIQPFFDPVRENNVAANDNLLLPLSFKLGSGDERQRNNGNCQDGSPAPADVMMIQCWEDSSSSALKQRFWKPLSTEISKGNEKECPKETDEEKRKHQEMGEYNQETEQKTTKCSSFFDGELEAIYRQADVAETAHQTASGSALTAEKLEAVKGRRERKRRKMLKDDEYASMGEFFESLVKRLMDHQEELHNKFLETMERLERERAEREEAWRQQELMNLKREADARADQRALASTIEVAILSYLEKITGQKISLPPQELESQTDEKGACVGMGREME